MTTPEHTSTGLNAAKTEELLERQRGEHDAVSAEELARLRADAERWRFGVAHGFPRRVRPYTTANFGRKWMMQVDGRGYQSDSAEETIDAARREKV